MSDQRESCTLTEGWDYQIGDGYFTLIGINDSILLFTSTRPDGKGVPLDTVKTELSAVMERLAIEEACSNSGGACDSAGCGNCHPENFATCQ
jgi:hypothetical protein